MVLAARIDHPLNRRMLCQEISDAASIFRLLAHAQRQRLQSLQQRPRVERRQGRTGMAEIILQLFIDPLLVGKDHATEAATLTVNMLGRGIDNHMSTELKRLLMKRGRKNIVDNDASANAVC